MNWFPRSSRIPNELGEALDLFSPGAASLRRVIKHRFEACQETSGMAKELAPPAAPKPKLSLSECRDLKTKFMEFFPGELWTPESIPSYLFVASLKKQFETGVWV